METPASLGLQQGGFNFDNCVRNAMLGRSGTKLPNATKTGTTIVGVVYKDGVVLGADTRATNGPIVADKNCEKIHFIADNIWCCGAGTAADTENTTGMIATKLELHRMATKRTPRTATALTMLKRYLFQYQGHVSAALVLGGVDCTGPSLYTIYPHGSTDKLPFVTMGSGSLAAMSVFETGYKDDLEEDEAKDLVIEAIKAGIFNDLGSGSNVDVCIIRKDDVEMLRNCVKPNERKYRRKNGYNFPPGTTTVISQTVTKVTNPFGAAAVEPEPDATPMTTDS